MAGPGQLLPGGLTEDELLNEIGKYQDAANRLYDMWQKEKIDANDARSQMKVLEGKIRSLELKVGSTGSGGSGKPRSGKESILALKLKFQKIKDAVKEEVDIAQGFTPEEKKEFLKTKKQFSIGLIKTDLLDKSITIVNEVYRFDNKIKDTKGTRLTSAMNNSKLRANTKGQEAIKAEGFNVSKEIQTPVQELDSPAVSFYTVTEFERNYLGWLIDSKKTSASDDELRIRSNAIKNLFRFVFGSKKIKDITGFYNQLKIAYTTLDIEDKLPCADTNTQLWEDFRSSIEWRSELASEELIKLRMGGLPEFNQTVEKLKELILGLHALLIRLDRQGGPCFTFSNKEYVTASEFVDEDVVRLLKIFYNFVNEKKAGRPVPDLKALTESLLTKGAVDKSETEQILYDKLLKLLEWTTGGMTTDQALSRLTVLEKENKELDVMNITLLKLLKYVNGMWEIKSKIELLACKAKACCDKKHTIGQTSAELQAELGDLQNEFDRLFRVLPVDAREGTIAQQLQHLRGALAPVADHHDQEMAGLQQQIAALQQQIAGAAGLQGVLNAEQTAHARNVARLTGDLAALQRDGRPQNAAEIARLQGDLIAERQGRAANAAAAVAQQAAAATAAAAELARIRAEGADLQRRAQDAEDARAAADARAAELAAQPRVDPAALEAAQTEANRARAAEAALRQELVDAARREAAVREEVRAADARAAEERAGRLAAIAAAEEAERQARAREADAAAALARLQGTSGATEAQLAEARAALERAAAAADAARADSEAAVAAVRAEAEGVRGELAAAQASATRAAEAAAEEANRLRQDAAAAQAAAERARAEAAAAGPAAQEAARAALEAAEGRARAAEEAAAASETARAAVQARAAQADAAEAAARELEALLGEAATATEELEARMRDLEESIGTKDEELGRLRGSIPALQAELEAARAAGGASGARAAETQAALTAAQGRLGEQEAEAARLQAELKGIREADAAKAADVARLGGELEAQRAAAVEAARAAEERHAAALEAERAAKQREIDAAAGRITGLQESLGAAGDRKRYLEAELTAATAAGGASGARATELAGELEEARAATAEQEAAIEELTATLNDMKKGSKDLAKRITALTQEKADAAAAAARAAEEAAAAKERAAAAEAREAETGAATAGRMAEAEGRVREAEGALEEAMRRIQALENIAYNLPLVNMQAGPDGVAPKRAAVSKLLKTAIRFTGFGRKSLQYFKSRDPSGRDAPLDVEGFLTFDELRALFSTQLFAENVNELRRLRDWFRGQGSDQDPLAHQRVMDVILKFIQVKEGGGAAGFAPVVAAQSGASGGRSAGGGAGSFVAPPAAGSADPRFAELMARQKAASLELAGGEGSAEGRDASRAAGVGTASDPSVRASAGRRFSFNASAGPARRTGSVPESVRLVEQWDRNGLRTQLKRYLGQRFQETFLYKRVGRVEASLSAERDAIAQTAVEILFKNTKTRVTEGAAELALQQACSEHFGYTTNYADYFDKGHFAQAGGAREEEDPEENESESSGKISPASAPDLCQTMLLLLLLEASRKSSEFDAQTFLDKAGTTLDALGQCPLVLHTLNALLDEAPAATEGGLVFKSIPDEDEMLPDQLDTLSRALHKNFSPDEIDILGSLGPSLTLVSRPHEDFQEILGARPYFVGGEGNVLNGLEDADEIEVTEEERAQLSPLGEGISLGALRMLYLVCLREVLESGEPSADGSPLDASVSRRHLTENPSPTSKCQVRSQSPIAKPKRRAPKKKGKGSLRAAK